jgi:dTDP-4-dehydrorhamnose 3,5-epimerase
MKVINVSLCGLKIIEPKVFGDERGFFLESYSHREFNHAIGRDITFVQDNHSRSNQGVLRGLHYQKSPHGQEKLVRVIQGEIFDVAVDIRTDSATYGQWHGEILSAENKRHLWIPVGFAHGFLVLSETAEVLYKTTDYWHPESEDIICWDDPTINIAWPSHTGGLQLSQKDQHGHLLPVR